MALVGRYNSLQVVKHTNFGLYLDGAQDGEILLPNRYIPKDIPSEDEDWLNVFIYLDSDDKLIATTEKPKVQVGEFASLKVVEVNSIGVFLDWGLPKDLLLPYSEEKRQMTAGEYCVVHVYLDKHTKRITATARLDRYLDKTPANYEVGQEVNLLVAEATDMGFKAIINNKHWGLIHKNVAKLRENNGTLPVSDKSDPAVISNLFGVSKGNFKKAIGALYKQGQIVIHADRIELS
jgi:predicted RNA-binding protein (virulence factor B family)